MNQDFLNIIDDIIKIGLFLYKDKDDPGSYQKALEKYLGYSLEIEINNPYEILIKYFKQDLINCFQYYLIKTEDNYHGYVSDVELVDTDNLKFIHLTIIRDENSNLSLTGIDTNLDKLEYKDET